MAINKLYYFTILKLSENLYKNIITTLYTYTEIIYLLFINLKSNILTKTQYESSLNQLFFFFSLQNRFKIV